MSDFGIEDIEFSREKANELLNRSEIPETRWERVKTEIDFRDLVEDMTGQFLRGDSISCPFHGRDSNPSFHVYRASNDATCFGCPEGDKGWNHIKFVSRLMGISRVQALFWLEKQYKLGSFIDDSIEEVEQEDDLTFDDVDRAFINKFKGEEYPDIEYMMQVREIYFKGKKDNNSSIIQKVLGQKIVNKLWKQKNKLIDI